MPNSMFYVSLAGEDTIASLRVAPGTQAGEMVQRMAAPGMPGPMCGDPDRLLLYVGLRAAKRVAVFRVAPAMGALDLIDTATLPCEPCYISLDRSRNFLFAACYRDGGVSVSPLRGDGSVGDSSQWLKTAAHAHCIQSDPGNRFALVPHVGESNCIDRLRFDETTGRLGRTWFSWHRPPRRSGPRHYRFHPSLNLVYFSNEQGCSLSTYGYDARNGTLRLLDMQATLPAGWSGANLSAEIRLHPDATALYVSNRGHDSIAVFALDPHTGLPAARADVPTESCPRAFSLSDDGRHLLVAGQKSAGATLYRVGADGIGLAPWHSIPVGDNPMGVELLAIAQG